MHPQKKNNWVDSSPKAGDLHGRMSDDIRYGTQLLHGKLWGFILDHHPQQFEDKVVKKGIRIGVIGKYALPIGIELTQWKYPVTFIEDEAWKIEAAQKDAKVQAGSIDEYLALDYRFHLPYVKVFVFIGIIDGEYFWNDDNKRKWLDYMKKRCRQILFSVVYDQRLAEFLTREYDAFIQIYAGKYMFVVIDA